MIWEPYVNVLALYIVIVVIIIIIKALFPLCWGQLRKFCF